MGKFHYCLGILKLSRLIALFEYSSSNGFLSFNINFECQVIGIIEDESDNHLSYLVGFPWSYTSCEERGLLRHSSFWCITPFEG